jgi:type I restriction enzyme, S subunit
MMQTSIVNYSKLRKHPEFRIDAECYNQYHLSVEKTIEKKGFNLIQDYSVSVINFGAYSLCNYIEFLESGKPFIVTEDIKNNIIDTNNLHYISDDVHLLLHKSHCKTGQVLLTMAGAYLGQAAVFNESFECSSNQAIAKITLKQNSINPFFLSTYLNCKYGQSQIERFRTGTGQPNLNLGLIKLIQIVKISSEIQKNIERVVLLALQMRKKGEEEYLEAQSLLLSELGLFSWQPRHELTFVKKYLETQQAERIDSEYFQPKYEEINHAIRTNPSGHDVLGNLVSITKCIEVGSDEYLDEGIPFVRVSDISPFEITEEKYISKELYFEIKQYQPKQGEILLSKDATPGIAYYLRECPLKMIPSGGILRLKLKDNRLDGDYLTLVLNSLIVKEQINRDVGGSVILHWRPDQVKETLIPILSKGDQDKIKEKIIQSFSLRKQSIHLLECAKRAVEIAIERNEDVAIKWLEEQTAVVEVSNKPAEKTSRTK